MEGFLSRHCLCKCYFQLLFKALSQKKKHFFTRKCDESILFKPFTPELPPARSVQAEETLLNTKKSKLFFRRMTGVLTVKPQT